MKTDIIEVTGLQIRELVALGLAVADGRLERMQESVRKVGVEHLSAGRWSAVEELAHWGACLDHVNAQQGGTPSTADIARWAAELSVKAAEEGEEEMAARWASFATALAEECDRDEN